MYKSVMALYHGTVGIPYCLTASNLVDAVHHQSSVLYFDQWGQECLPEATGTSLFQDPLSPVEKVLSNVSMIVVDCVYK